MNYLWGNNTTDVDERVMRFLAADDVILDRQLLHYDIQATVAHVEGLARIGLLSPAEQSDLCTGLDELARQVADGKFVLDERYEDGHSAIEAWLVERLGEVGEKVHTGRSRNDQVLVATRLFMRDALEELVGHCRVTAEACLAQARDYAHTPMPGYTHMQRAVVSSVGTWFAGFAEAFIDNAVLAEASHNWINANPLGTAAGYGVNLLLDRDYTTSALAFDRLQLNPVYTQNSRGKFELQALNSLGQALLDVRRYAWDLSLFTSSEFGFVKLPEQLTTGSSIMPNKRNPDLIELLRATHGVVQGAITEMHAVLSLPSGYHRDLQTTKGPLLRAFARGLEAMSCMPALILSTSFNEEKLRGAIEPAMYATDQ
ncbi:MAG: argininosuccinate lyase, partial [Gammaproteobacteria bacterium]|nr:argininosuccinate lyase [Gammaproteobacteria bacterium]